MLLEACDIDLPSVGETGDVQPEMTQNSYCYCPRRSSQYYRHVYFSKLHFYFI